MTALAAVIAAWTVVCVPLPSAATVNIGVKLVAAGRPAVGFQLSVVNAPMVPVCAR